MKRQALTEIICAAVTCLLYALTPIHTTAEAAGYVAMYYAMARAAAWLSGEGERIMTEQQIRRYLKLVDRRLYILEHSGTLWKPEYDRELERIDREVKELRAAIDQEHERRKKNERER